jgi:hypothetical protein
MGGGLCVWCRSWLLCSSCIFGCLGLHALHVFKGKECRCSFVRGSWFAGVWAISFVHRVQDVQAACQCAMQWLQCVYWLACLASAGETWVRIPARVPHPGGYRVLELTAGLKVISIACTRDLRDWGTLLGPLGTLMSLWLAG